VEICITRHVPGICRSNTWEGTDLITEVE
jgi:hypothetical protein